MKDSEKGRNHKRKTLEKTKRTQYGKYPIERKKSKM
jgi:hypothetical protein